jgi:hypothetical protein
MVKCMEADLYAKDRTLISTPMGVPRWRHKLCVQGWAVGVGEVQLCTGVCRKRCLHWGHAQRVRMLYTSVTRRSE